MNVRQNLISAEKYSLKCPYSMTPKYIIVHNTANDASAANEIAYMIRNDNEVSFHYAVDDKEIVQGVPENRNTWNCGDGSGVNAGNRNGIAVEICYSKSGGDRFTAAEQLAAKFIASKLKEYGWGIDKVKKHQDFNGKYCPHRTLDLGWQRFLNMINTELGGTDAIPAQTVNKTVKELTGVSNVSKGDKDRGVQAYQAILVRLGYDTGGVDGIFGSKTYAAVKAYQQSKGLSADGIIGVNTGTALCREIVG